MTILYETDFTAWLESQINLMKTKKFDKLDMTHLLEEMEDLGGFKNSIESHLQVAMTHMLKLKYAHDDYCTRMWQISIDNARTHIENILKNNPGLASYPSKILETTYVKARKSAAKQTGLEIDVFPKDNSWLIEDILGYST